ncbi:hypothetical protein FBQ82_09720 [Anaerolineae bacterium CFX7]|nr:hypothetical protein [Anaerolineae bacterium CFX7]
MKRNYFLWSVGLGLVFILSACANSATPTAPVTATNTPTATRPAVVFPTAAPGWKIFKRATYQLALPDSWQEIQLHADEIKNAVAAAQVNNPPLAETLRALLETEQYKELDFYAVDKSATPRPRTISIARAALPPNQNIASIAAAYAETLPQAVRGAQVTKTQAPFQLNALNVAAFEYTLSFVDANAKLVTLRGAQYLYVLETGAAYLVTITGDATDATLSEFARSIAATFAATAP